MSRLTVVVALCLAASRAAAEPTAAAEQARGEDLARRGRWSEAIEAFKSADRVEPTAEHACLIALAYARRELWPQAEVFFATCLARAGAGDRVPPWLAEARDQLDERLAAANVALVDIAVTPATAAAQLAMSSFAPDETFTPRKLHLAFGHHVIVARAPGYADGRVELDITDKTPRHVAIELHAVDRGSVVARATRPGRTLMIAGAVALGAGAIAYGVMSVGWVKLNAGVGFDGPYQTAYEVGRVATIAS